jgi:hypothetical protein
MKNHLSKNTNRSLFSFIKLKTFSTKTSLIFIGSFFLFNTGPSSQGSCLFETINHRSAIQQSHYGHLKLKIESNSLSSDTDFYFNSNATRGLDPGYDAAIGGNPQSFSIYSFLLEGNTGIALAIQALSNTDMNDVTIPLGVNISQGQEVTFSIAESDIIDSISMYLEDRANNTTTLLNTTDYTFSPDANLTGTGRFYLIFEGDALGTTEQSLEGLDIYSDTDNKTIVINGKLLSPTNYKLYDIHGRLFRTTELDVTSSNQLIDTSQLSTGIYIIEVVDDANQKRVQKVVIR